MDMFNRHRRRETSKRTESNQMNQNRFGKRLIEKKILLGCHTKIKLGKEIGRSGKRENEK